MSSPTDTSGRAARAVRLAAGARVASWVAAIAGAGVAALFLVQAGTFRSLGPDTADSPPLIEKPDQITATDSTVKGVDRQNQPYEVSAQRGWQDKDMPHVVHLEHLTAAFRKPGGKVYNVTAPTGIYDTKLKQMDLSGQIVITEGPRFTARLLQARVMVEDKSLVSDAPVDVDLADGKITASGLQITHDGDRILFLNGVKAQFGGDTAKGDQTP